MGEAVRLCKVCSIADMLDEQGVCGNLWCPSRRSILRHCDCTTADWKEVLRASSPGEEVHFVLRACSGCGTTRTEVSSPKVVAMVEPVKGPLEFFNGEWHMSVDDAGVHVARGEDRRWHTTLTEGSAAVEALLREHVVAVRQVYRECEAKNVALERLERAEAEKKAFAEAVAIEARGKEEMREKRDALVRTLGAVERELLEARRETTRLEGAQSRWAKELADLVKSLGEAAEEREMQRVLAETSAREVVATRRALEKVHEKYRALKEKFRREGATEVETVTEAPGDDGSQ